METEAKLVVIQEIGFFKVLFGFSLRFCLGWKANCWVADDLVLVWGQGAYMGSSLFVDI